MLKVAILMGSESDMPTMEKAEKILTDFGVGFETAVISAHRNPDRLTDFVKGAAERGIRVFLCGAGLAAALPGAVAAHTDLPVIGVPLDASLGGLDSLLSIAQMPPGVPVACVGVNNARNGAYLAISILALEEEGIAAAWHRFREEQRA